MNKQERINAVIASIEHWERMATGNELDGESPCEDDCALCKEWADKSCEGCPIKTFTGKFCYVRWSPYRSAAQAWPDRGFRSAAKEMVAHLFDVLDNEEKMP